MLTETVMGIVFAGHFSAVAVLLCLAWQRSLAEAVRASFNRTRHHVPILND
jgi:hypothetical protein